MVTPRKKRSRREQKEDEGSPPAKRQDTSKTPQPPVATQAPETPAVPVVPQQNMQVVGVALSREVTIPVESETKVQDVVVGPPPETKPESVPAIASPPTTKPLPIAPSTAKPITDEAVVLSWEKQLLHAEADVERLQERLDSEFCRWGTIVLVLVLLFSVVTGLWVADRIQFQIATADLRQHLQECQVLTARVRDEYYVEELETQVRDWKQAARAKDVELESLRNVCVTAISNLAHE